MIGIRAVAKVPRRARGAGADLVEVDGGAEHEAGQDVLPVLVDADDDQPGREQFRDEDANERAEHRAAPAEQAGAADHDSGDDHQVVQRVTGDRGGVEVGEVQDPGQAGEQPAQPVHLDQVPVHVDAGPERRLGVGSDRVGVPAEPGEGQDQAEQQRREERDDDEPLHPAKAAGADRVDQGVRHRRDVVPARDQVGQALGDAKAHQRRDERRDLELGHREPWRAPNAAPVAMPRIAPSQIVPAPALGPPLLR